MRKGIVIAFACLLLLISGTAGCGAGRYDATMAAAREAVWRTLTNGGGSSATVAVMDGGKIVYSERFGAAERAEVATVIGQLRALKSDWEANHADLIRM